jgi:hypothetical protein
MKADVTHSAMKGREGAYDLCDFHNSGYRLTVNGIRLVVGFSFLRELWIAWSILSALRMNFLLGRYNFDL